MTAGPPRVAYFSDTYHEIDGVANTARQFEAYARRHNLPFLLAHGGYEGEKIVREGSFTRVELPRSRFGFAVDRKHEFDLAFLRHTTRVEAILAEFRPDVLHITGPSDVGIIGALVAHRMKIPLFGSWHTNLHEYAGQRALPLLKFLPAASRKKADAKICDLSLRALARFYKMPRVLMAPNPELIALLEKITGKPCYLMGRGVDTVLFNPSRRERSDNQFTIGYVGRITVEKNINTLVEIEQALIAAGVTDCKLLIVGQGASEADLKSSLKNREFTGVLAGEALARAYANMDVFVFPSKTDTFGNVVLEALSSGVPALVTDQGGPQFIVKDGETGFVCKDVAAFVDHILQLKRAPEELQRMRVAARKSAEAASWDSIFDAVYRAYDVALQATTPAPVKFTGNLPLKIF